MKTKTQPFRLVQFRIDVVKKVPDWHDRWPTHKLALGQKVYRISNHTVRDFDGHVFGLGMSYSKFECYSDAHPS